MDDHAQQWLAKQFEEQRAHLRAVAYRMLGSPSEAEDAVQEAWLHLSRADTSAVQNLGGWLTTVVARICLDMLRTRTARREEALEARASTYAGSDPEDAALLADAVGVALLVVLDTLTPAERLAFVLHDLFDVPFDTIAPIVGRSPTATRQLASRARRRVRGQRQGDDVASSPGADLARQRTVVSAFMAAAHGGDFAALLTLLDPDVVLRADSAAVAAGATSDIHGAAAVARQFSGRARLARPARIGGGVGAVWLVRGRLRIAFAFTIADGKITAIEIIADPARLSQLDVAPLDN